MGEKDTEINQERSKFLMSLILLLLNECMCVISGGRGLIHSRCTPGILGSETERMVTVNQNGRWRTDRGSR